MKILGIGIGREIALQRSLAQDPTVAQRWLLWDAQNPAVSRAAVLAEATHFRPDFAVVWTQGHPLIYGVANDLATLGIPTVGPKKHSVELERSKFFGNQFAKDNGIPVPAFENYRDLAASAARLRELAATGQALPVLKPDGLPASKGVCLPTTLDQALGHLELLSRHYGPNHLHQERVRGHEFSLIALSDGEHFKLMPQVKVVKRVTKDGLSVPEGAFSPGPGLPSGVVDRALNEIIEPTIRGMRKIGEPYKGFVFTDNMLSSDGRLWLLDYNCELAYPETEVILARVASNFAELLAAAAFGTLDKLDLHIGPQAAVCVAIMAKGYPGTVEPGAEVFGIEEAESIGCQVYPIGVSEGPARRILGTTARAILVVGQGTTVKEARAKAYEGVSHIHFDGMWYNPDIAEAIDA